MQTRDVSIPPGQIFLIGDAHVGLADGDEKLIVAWLGRLSSFRPSALYLNGDIFHYLIGHRNFMTTSIERVLARIHELRDNGTAVHYIEGNREFFLEGSAAERAVTHLSLSSSFQAGPRKFHVVHGDMINDRDLPYRFWRRFSKNAVMRLAVGLVPKTLARKIVDRVEQRLAKSNFKHKRRIPVELMEAYGRARQQQGDDVVVFGHFHKKLILPAGEATVAVLPAWYAEEESMMVSPTTGEFSFVRL